MTGYLQTQISMIFGQVLSILRRGASLDRIGVAVRYGFLGPFQLKINLFTSFDLLFRKVSAILWQHGRTLTLKTQFILPFPLLSVIESNF